MTENEAIEHLKYLKEQLKSDSPDMFVYTRSDIISVNMAIKALEEIQQYQAIGTVEQIKKLVRFLSLDNDNQIIEDMELLNKYKFIGTVEDCQEARERQRCKKPSKKQVGGNILMSKIYYCPTCNKKLYDCAFKNGKLDYVSHGSKKSKFCKDCGQKLNWSE